MKKTEIDSINRIADLNIKETELTNFKTGDMVLHLYERSKTAQQSYFLICTISKATVEGKILKLLDKSILFCSSPHMKLSNEEITYNTRRDYPKHSFYALPYLIFPEYFI